MKIQQADKNRIKKICTHEAGHYIVARELSFKSHKISATFYFPTGQSGESIIEHFTPSINNLKELETYLERRIKVLYAGTIAEAMEENGDYNSDYALDEWRKGGGMNDYAKIGELTQALRNIRYPETIEKTNAQIELDIIDKGLFKQSATIVYERIELIYGVGDMLLQKVKKYNIKYILAESEIDTIKRVKDLYIDGRK